MPDGKTPFKAGDYVEYGQPQDKSDDTLVARGFVLDRIHDNKHGITYTIQDETTGELFDVWEGNVFRRLK